MTQFETMSLVNEVVRRQGSANSIKKHGQRKCGREATEARWKRIEGKFKKRQEETQRTS